MNQLVPVNTFNDIFVQYRNTPIGDLIEYHNLDKSFSDYSKAKLLTGMCMDHRKKLNIPDNFAYIIRTGGANLRYNEFQISFTVSIGGIEHIALIGHNDCGMVNLNSKKENFIVGLVEKSGWTEERALEHFSNFAPMFEIDNAVDFVVSEAKRLRLKYPKITIAPMLYNVDDNKLYLIKE